MIFKHSKLGDLIEAQSELGNLVDIDLFTTKLYTPKKNVLSFLMEFYLTKILPIILKMVS